MKRRICVVTGSRAEYGLLRPVLKLINDDPNLLLQLVVTGSHLVDKFGLTIEEITADGLRIDMKIPILNDDDTEMGVAFAVAKGVFEFTKALKSLEPEILLILGDRSEVFAAATSALITNIPIAHIHGGEASEGAIDEALRHCITKMSHMHFVSTEIYRNRVIQLGESPESVRMVGALGVEIARSFKPVSRKELGSQLGIEFSERNVLITFHPVTLEKESSLWQVKELLAALTRLKDATLIFTYPNSDEGSKAIIDELERFAQITERAYVFASLGQNRYFSLLNYVDLVIGNSSSGIIEVPTFRKPTINIGDRQRGRVKGGSVLDCLPNKEDISRAFKLALSPEFLDNLSYLENPYDSPGTSFKIVESLAKWDLTDVLKKKFHDLEVPN